VLELQGQKNLDAEAEAEALKNDFDPCEISPFIFQLRELPIILNLPQCISANHGQSGLPYKVERLDSGVNFSEMVDEYADNTPTNLQEILSKIFLIDGRIYKHYRLLPWFPQYMQYLYRSQLLIMDNNDGGED